VASVPTAARPSGKYTTSLRPLTGASGGTSGLPATLGPLAVLNTNPPPDRADNGASGSAANRIGASPASEAIVPSAPFSNATAVPSADQAGSARRISLSAGERGSQPATPSGIGAPPANGTARRSTRGSAPRPERSNPYRPSGDTDSRAASEYDPRAVPASASMASVRTTLGRIVAPPVLAGRAPLGEDANVGTPAAAAGDDGSGRPPLVPAQRVPTTTAMTSVTAMTTGPRSPPRRLGGSATSFISPSLGQRRTNNEVRCLPCAAAGRRPDGWCAADRSRRGSAVSASRPSGTSAGA
jgi:hypothetical protein